MWSRIQRKLFVSAAALLLIGGATGCAEDDPGGEPITHTEASSALRTNLEHNLVAATDSMRFMDSMQVTTQLFDYSGTLSASVSGEPAL